MESTQRAIGIIAAEGAMPALIAGEARTQGCRVVVSALKGMTVESPEAYADVLEAHNIGRLNSIISFFKSNGVGEIIAAGKIPKTALLRDGNVLPDLRAVGLLLRVKDYRDDSLINALIAEFERDGLRVLDMRTFCAALLTREGVLTKTKPTSKQERDIEFGMRMAREVGRLDIGQTIVVKDRNVLAVEAAEGTDEAIRRGGLLAGTGAVVIKVARPGQDLRTDIPVIGERTLEVMREVHAGALAIEAGKTILIDQTRLCEMADKSKIAIVGACIPQQDTAEQHD